jgi:hypothetical protein
MKLPFQPLNCQEKNDRNRRGFAIEQPISTMIKTASQMKEEKKDGPK